MTKRHFIELADWLRKLGMMPASIDRAIDSTTKFKHPQAEVKALKDALMQAIAEELADFCRTQNPRFNRDRWLNYIAGKCGPNGGAVKERIQ